MQKAYLIFPRESITTEQKTLMRFRHKAVIRPVNIKDEQFIRVSLTAENVELLLQKINLIKKEFEPNAETD